MYVCKHNEHNDVVACRFDEVTKMNAENSILKREALEGAGNVLPDPSWDVKVELNSGCFCGHYAAHLKYVCMYVCMYVSIINIMASWRAGLTK